MRARRSSITTPTAPVPALTQMHRAVLGLWEGDPTLCEYWGPFNMTMMALFRRREGPSGPNGIDLVEVFAQHGIRGSLSP